MLPETLEVDQCRGHPVLEVHAVEPRQVFVDRLGVFGGLEVGIAHEVPHLGIGLDDLVDEVDGGLVLGDVFLELLDQDVLLLLLGVDAADVAKQVTEGVAAQRAFDPAPLFGVGAALDVACRGADQAKYLRLDDVDRGEVEPPVVEYGEDAVRGFEVGRGDDNQRAVVGEELPQRNEVGRRKRLGLFKQQRGVFTVTQTAVFQLVRTGDQLCDATRLLNIGAEEVGIFLAGGQAVLVFFAKTDLALLVEEVGDVVCRIRHHGAQYGEQHRERRQSLLAVDHR